MPKIFVVLNAEVKDPTGLNNSKANLDVGKK